MDMADFGGANRPRANFLTLDCPLEDGLRLAVSVDLRNDKVSHRILPRWQMWPSTGTSQAEFEKVKQRQRHCCKKAEAHSNSLHLADVSGN